MLKAVFSGEYEACCFLSASLFFLAFNFFVFSQVPTLSVDYLYNHKIILFEQIKPPPIHLFTCPFNKQAFLQTLALPVGRSLHPGMETPSPGANLRHHRGFKPLPCRLERQTPL